MRLKGLLLLKSIIESKTSPIDRSEGEIAGYRDVLQFVHSSYGAIPVNTNTILQLHKELYTYIFIEGGQWKNVDNVISEIYPDGTKYIRFESVLAFETPEAMRRLIVY